MITGIQIVLHTIYIYEQTFNTVQTATANNPLGPAEGQFCMSMCNILQMYSLIGTFLYTCVLTDTQVLETIFTFSSQKPRAYRIFSNDPPINNIIQVITLWEPASQHFLWLLYIQYFGSLQLLHSSCAVTFFSIHTEIKTNVTNALNRGRWHLKVLYRFIPGRKGRTRLKCLR